MSCNDKNHPMHICSLKAQGLDDRIKSLADNPTVTCNKCGARANSSEYLCAAHLLDTAPSVEGGHGSVSISEVGKPHEGTRSAKSAEAEIAVKEVPVDGICSGY